jgi:hypothetical protein
MILNQLLIMVLIKLKIKLKEIQVMGIIIQTVVEMLIILDLILYQMFEIKLKIKLEENQAKILKHQRILLLKILIIRI